MTKNKINTVDVFNPELWKVDLVEYESIINNYDPITYKVYRLLKAEGWYYADAKLNKDMTVSYIAASTYEHSAFLKEKERGGY